jgi:hypothetical protein
MVRNADWWGLTDHPHNIDRIVHAWTGDPERDVDALPLDSWREVGRLDPPVWADASGAEPARPLVRPSRRKPARVEPVPLFTAAPGRAT